MSGSELLTLVGSVAISLRGVTSRTSDYMHVVIALESWSDDEDDEDDEVALVEDDV